MASPDYMHRGYGKPGLDTDLSAEEIYGRFRVGGEMQEAVVTAARSSWEMHQSLLSSA